MAGVSRHPFEVGRQYRNEDGVYTVLRIQEPDMVIQYENGRTLMSSIALQARIWERICEEDAIGQAVRSRSAPSSRPRGGRGDQRGCEFRGLQDADFRRGVTGTSWRGRGELGGQLAAQLAALSGQPFESHAVYRLPEVYVALPQFFTPGDSFRSAKFFFRLDERETHHGFCVEKSNEAMDASWDWLRFTAALATDKRLQAQTLVAMQARGLAWRIETSIPGKGWSREVRCVAADKGGLRRQGEADDAPLSWPEFVALLGALPADRWCDLYLSAQLEKTRAIELRVELAQEAAAVFYALLPLYMAAVRSR